jgi:hypothetical protein
MPARALIDGASLGPDALKVVGQAFDLAWAEIAPYFGGDPIVREGARLTLANAILSMASEDSRDVDVLKNAGLQAMTRSYQSLPIVSPKISDRQ